METIGRRHTAYLLLLRRKITKEGSGMKICPHVKSRTPSKII